MPDETKGLFGSEHLAVIERALKDPAAYGVLSDSLGKLEEIINEAKRRGLLCFKCHMGRYPAFPLQMCFGDFEGNRYKVNLSFGRAYEKQRPYFDMETALALSDAVRSLVSNIDGIQPMRHIRLRRKTE